MLPPRPPQKRKLSAIWWDRQVIRGFLPRIVYVALGFIIMAIWVGVMLHFAGRETKARKLNEVRDLQEKLKSGNTKEDLAQSVFLQALLRQFDPDQSVLTVDWSSVFLNDTDETFSPFTGAPLGFYRDVRTVYDSNTTDIIRDEVPQEDDTFYFRLDNLTAPRLGVLGVHEWDAVGTEIDMGPRSIGKVWTEPQFGYPWDEWSGSIVTALNDLGWAAFAAREMGFESESLGLVAFPPIGVTVAGSVLNWKMQATSIITPSCLDENVRIDQATCELEITFVAKRPGIVIFCVIAVVTVNWLSTIAIFLVTGEAILLRRTHILEGTDMLGVCFAALFALPTVRQLLPGAPSAFGAVIDLVGILPNVIIISLCTTVFAAARLRMRRQQPIIADEKSV